MAIDFSQYLEIINFKIYIFFRILGFFISSPIFGEKFISSKKVKLFLSIFTTIIIPYPDEFLIISILDVIEQFFIGIILGTILNILFIAIQISGNIISIKSGFSFFNSIGIHTNNYDSIISNLLKVTLSLIFLSLNIHIIILKFFFNTFCYLPITKIRIDKLNLIFLKMSNFIFYYGLLILLPSIIIFLIINFTLGCINRFIPQFSIFSVGFSLTLLGSAISILITILIVSDFSENMFFYLLNTFKSLLEKS